MSSEMFTQPVLANKPIPVSVVVVTKNEERKIEACLEALNGFDDLWVVDSSSDDRTKELSAAAGANVVDFQWNGQYPKKRQWCLEMLKLKYGFVFFVDADESVTPALIEEIRALDFSAAGYFVKGRYLFQDRMLRFGLHNNKLCLIDRQRMKFPVVNDLDLPGMGEIEGHYQPVLKAGFESASIGQLKESVLHDAFESEAGWLRRHERYAAWERGMNARDSWPQDSRLAKRVFKALPFQGVIAFVHSYILKLGILDGAAGFYFAKTRWRYYRMIAKG